MDWYTQSKLGHNINNHVVFSVSTFYIPEMEFVWMEAMVVFRYHQHMSVVFRDTRLDNLLIEYSSQPLICFISMYNEWLTEVRQTMEQTIPVINFWDPQSGA